MPAADSPTPYRAIDLRGAGGALLASLFWGVNPVAIKAGLEDAPPFRLAALRFLLGGAVVTETMFSWPGVGRLAVGAIISSDFPTAQGAIMILAVSFLAINLVVDVLYVYLDPRVQRE